MIELRTFGALDLRDADGREVRAILAQPKRLALLVYLAAASDAGGGGTFHRRDALLALLWPESDSARARAALSRAIHFLRSSLGEGVLVNRGDDELAVDLERLSCDAVRFRSALRDADHAGALELYRGDFLEGFFLDDVPEFERWLERARAEYKEGAAAAARTLAEQAERGGNPELALHWSRRALTHAPYDETEMRRVLRLLDRTGDRAGALDAYHRFAQRLREDLDVEPSAETRDLIAAMTEARGRTVPVVPTGSVSAPASRPAPRTRRRAFQALAFVAILVVAVVAILGNRLRRGEALGIARTTDNREAYILYVRGRYFWNKRSERDIQRALDYYGQAVDLDPSYALAWSGIADAWIFRGWYAQLPPRETFPRAKHAALRALEFDSTLAEAHASLAHIHFEYDHDWAAAEREYLRAIALKPAYAGAHHWYGGFLSAMGRHAQALAQADTALQLDPLAPIIQTWVGLRHYFARHYDQATAEYAKAVQLSDAFAPAHWHLSWALLESGRLTEGVAEAKRAAGLDSGNLLFVAGLGYAYARAGMSGEARAVLARLADASRTRYVPAYDVALIHLALGSRNQALAWLDRALAEQSVMTGYLRVDPRLDPVRGDPRFKRLLQRAALDF